MDAGQVCEAFKAAWGSNSHLHQSLAQVTQQPEQAPSPTAPGMHSVAGHFEFCDGARFKLRYSYEPRCADSDDATNAKKKEMSFLSVEDDVGLHFGFLDDINAFLLDVDVATTPAQDVIAKALVKAVKMHTRAAAASSKSADAANGTAAASRTGNGIGITCNSKPSGRSAAYRIEDHPLAAMLAAQQPNARFNRQRPQPFAPPNAIPARNAADGVLQELAAANRAGPPEPGAVADALFPLPNGMFRGGRGGANGNARPPAPAGAAPDAAAAAAAENNNAAAGAAAANANATENPGAGNGDRKRGGPAQMDFGSSRLATHALMQQLRILEKQDTRAEGFTATLQGEDLYTWDIKLYFDDTSSSLGRDLSNLAGVDCLQLEFKFPSSFPHEPPVVRFVSPVIVGGHVTLHGAICMELLTAAGWTPCNSVDAVCVQIRALLLAGNARIDMARPFATERYTIAGALRDLSSIVFSHGWTVDNGRVAKVKRPRNDSVGPNR